MKEDIKRINDASMEILEKVGVMFHHTAIIELLKKNDIKVSGNIAYFTEEQVMKWISKAPSEFTVFARNPKYNMKIGGDNIEFAPGYGAATVVELDGTRRIALYEDYIKFVKLVQQCDLFNINGGIIVEPNDLNIKDRLSIMMYSSVAHSDKCLIGGAGGYKEAQDTMEILEIVFNGKKELIKKPRIMTLINSTSPLMFDKNALETMLVYAKYNQPVIITPASMSGTTSPVTLAGTIALSNAEALAGIVVVQMINEGCPVIYGFQSSRSDMRTGACSLGAPGTGWCIAYGAKLAKEYGLPCRGGGTNNDAKSVSIQSAYEGMLAMTISCQEKMNLVIHTAGTLDSNGIMSYEQFIIDLEMTGMIMSYLKGFKINDDTLAVDLIKKVGHGGQYLTSEHTIKYCRKEPWKPNVSHRGVLKDVRDNNEQNLLNIQKTMKKMLNSYKKPELPIDTKNQILKLLSSKGININKLE